MKYCDHCSRFLKRSVKCLRELPIFTVDTYPTKHHYDGKGVCEYYYPRASEGHFRPCRDGVLLRPLGPVVQLKSNLIEVVDLRSDDVQKIEEFWRGEVANIGPGKWAIDDYMRLPVGDFEIGDEVMFIWQAHKPASIEIEGETHCIVDPGLIIAVVEPEEPEAPIKSDGVNP